MTFSVTRIRNGGAYLLHVGTHEPDGRIDVVLIDETAVDEWFSRWLYTPERYEEEMRKMIAEMTPEERLGRTL